MRCHPYPTRRAEPTPVLPEIGPILDEELAGLPEWYREAILLCDLRGVSREDAARATGGAGRDAVEPARQRAEEARGAARAARVSLSVAGIAGSGRSGSGGHDGTKRTGRENVWARGGLVGRRRRARSTRPPHLREDLPCVRRCSSVLLVVAAAAGAVVAAGSGNQNPPVEPPKAGVVAKGDQALQGKDEAAGQKLAYTSQPRTAHRERPRHRQCAVDLLEPRWEPVRCARTGERPESAGRAQLGSPIVEVVSPWFRNNGSEALVSVQFGLAGTSKLIGFTPSGNGLITDQREYQLVSGFHRLRFLRTEFTPERAAVNSHDPRIVELDSEETHGYAFAADGKTFRTLAYERDGSGQPKKIEVREVDATTGKTLKSLLKIDYTEHLLSPNGKRLATLDADGKLVIIDVDRGAKLSAHSLPEPAALPPLDSSRQAQFGGNFAGMLGGGGSRSAREHHYLVFSPDASKLVVSRAIGQTVVIDTETGKPLPALEGVEMMRTHPTSHAFTGDGRLLVMTGTHYTIQKTTVRDRQVAKEQDVLSPGRNFLTVWDTQTGKVVKSWDRSPRRGVQPRPAGAGHPRTQRREHDAAGVVGLLRRSREEVIRIA